LHGHLCDSTAFLCSLLNNPMMGARDKINAISLNVKIKKTKIVDIWGYKLPINVQNFMQKDSAQAKISLKVVGGYFFTHPVYIIVQVLRVDQIGQVSPVRKTSAICSMLLSLEPRSDFRCPHSCTRCLVNTARGSIVSCRRVLYRKIGRR